MKFFITGGAGFIGSILVNKLTEKQEEVTVYDNFHLGKKKYLNSKLKNLKIIKGDVRNFKHLNKSMRGNDFVFHFAANSNIQYGLQDSRFDFEINTIGTLNVLDAMIKNKIRNFVFASTSAVLGYPTKLPTPEDYGPCLPESFYGASKLACEGYVSAYSNLYGIKSWIFRFANITGSPATHGIIHDFMKKLKKSSDTFEVLGNGFQEKSYITNYMLIDAMLHVINRTKNKKQQIFLYNIGNIDTVKVKKIAKTFLKEYKSDKKIKYTGGKGGWKGDVSKIQLDIKKITKDGWVPDRNSKECIIDTMKNYWE